MVIDNDAPANCTEIDIQILKQTEWKNNGEDTYAFNGDVVSELPERLGPFTVFLVQFTKPVIKIGKNSCGFQRTETIFRCMGSGRVQA